MNSIWKFATAANVHFGRGSRNRLAAELNVLGGKRPMVITDNVLTNLPLVAEAIDSLRIAGMDVQVFTDGEPEPAVEVACSASAMAVEHKADVVIGIGGGSNLDVAKVTAVVLRYGGQPQDYFGFDAVPGPVPPLIALPTTAGTGSEVSHSAVLTDQTQNTKVSMLSRWLRPSVAIVDPAFTDSCPPSVTGQSGIDALVHAIEAFTNRPNDSMEGVDQQARAYEGSYRLTGLLATEAIRLIGANLATVVTQPNNNAARDAMAEASMLAGMAFSNSGVGIVHALEYPIGALTHCGHGEGNGLLLPHVMRYNLEHCRVEFAEIARLLGESSQEMGDGEASEAAIDAVEKLQRAAGIKTKLADLGLNKDQIPSVASVAIKIRRLMDLNRRPPSESDLVEILEAAF
ncbi:MAG: iron-containing alcohol dehydrogenase [Aureliella sp.]